MAVINVFANLIKSPPHKVWKDYGMTYERGHTMVLERPQQGRAYLFMLPVTQDYARGAPSVSPSVLMVNVSTLYPLPQVDLTNPVKTVLVQLTRNACGLSVVTHYKELARFNIRKLTEVEDPDKKKDPKAPAARAALATAAATAPAPEPAAVAGAAAAETEADVKAAEV